MAAHGTYSEDEVRAIIERALQDHPGGGLTHEDLLAVASEVGLSPDAVESAAREVREAGERDEAKRRIVARRRRHFGSHLWVYLVIIGFLFAVNLLTSPGQWWVAFPIVLWGLVLLFHARAALSSDVSERAIQRETRRRLGEQPSGDRASRGERRRASRVRLPSPSEDAIPEDDARRRARGMRRD